MIKSLALANFQSHADTRLEFVPGVNVIVGPSDSGKTALFRSLTWLAMNRPAGDSFRSHWGGDTVVEVETEEGTVKRTRTKSTNLYEVDGKELKAFGRGVPDQVVSLLQLDAINWQHQLAAPFLLSDTPGEVARQLNAAADLDKIDTALAFIQKHVRDLSRRASDEEARLENRRGQLQTSYGTLEQSLKLHGRARRKMRLLEEICARTDRLDQLARNISEALAERLEVERVARQASYLKALDRLEQEAQATATDIVQLDTRLAALQEAETKRQVTELELTSRQKTWEEIVPNICPLCGAPFEEGRR